MGINEFAGYLSVAIVGFATAWVACEYGLRPYLFYIGIGLVLGGLILSWVFMKETIHHTKLESVDNKIIGLKNIFWDTTWRDKNLGSVTQEISFIFVNSFYAYLILSSCLGLGTAFVYPTFLATIAQYTNPSDRAKSLGTFRFWRDLGYAIGALLTGILVDNFSIGSSIIIIGLITIFSSFILLFRMS